MKTRIGKILGKMTRITAAIFMVVSSFGFNGLSLIVEAKTAGGNTGYGQNAYGYMRLVEMSRWETNLCFVRNLVNM